MIRRSGCLLLLLFSFLGVYCQNFPMLHFTVEDGLPSNNIYSVFKDSKGFIWICTDKGIARYNGIRFEVFTTFDGLPDNEIFFVHEDKSGSIWLATYNGELCYYKDGVFHNAKNTPFLKLSVKASHIGNICDEDDGSITISFFEGAKYVNISNEKCKYFDCQNIKNFNKFELARIKKIESNKYEFFLFDKTVFLDTACNILKIDNVGLSFDSSFRMCQQQRNVFNESYFLLETLHNTKMLSEDFFKTHFLYQIYTNDSILFYCTNKGLYINKKINILKNDKISSIVYDKDSTYWLSTLDNGVYHIKISFSNTKLCSDCYSDVVTYAYANKGQLFYTTRNRDLYSLKLNGKKTKCLLDYKKVYGVDSNKAFTSSIQSTYFIDSNYHYYSCHSDKIISIKNLLSPEICTYYCYFYYGGIKGLCTINNNVYIFLRNAIQKFQEDELQCGKNLRSKLIVSAADNERIFTIAKADDNNIWYSTLKNVYKIENDSCVLQSQFKGVTFKSFEFICDYLVGYTHDNQLLVCNNIKGSIAIDTVPEQNCIWTRLFKIDPSTILISTDKLYRVLTIDTANRSKKYTITTIEDPFIPTHAETICSDGSNCYFFKNGSVTSIAINSLFVKAVLPKLFFSTLKTTKGSYPVTQEMELPFDEAQNISISFTTVSNSGKDIYYQYSVSNGIQDNWRDIVGDINLAHPSYGTYSIKVRAKSISSAYCSPIVFKLHIQNPFWATWWFIGLSICSGLAIVWFIVRYRFRSLLHKKEKLHETEMKFMKSEYKALNALMNPHFIFNTLNNVQDLVNKNDKLAANEYLRVFADLIRQNMSNISKEVIPLQKEIELVKNYLLLEKLRFEDTLNYEINITEGMDLGEIMVPPLLVQPLVENSIKHGIFHLQSAQGFIQINIYERRNLLFIEVKDNGVGLQQGMKTKTSKESFGLQNIKKRVEQLSILQNKEITFDIAEINEGGKDKLTVVTISIAISS